MAKPWTVSDAVRTETSIALIEARTNIEAAITAFEHAVDATTKTPEIEDAGRNLTVALDAIRRIENAMRGEGGNA